MLPRITGYGGVGEIGGNKFLLEDKDTRVLLDFGTGFSDGAEYFNDVIMPRTVNGAGDLFEFGLLPEIPGLYSKKALQNTGLKHTRPEVDAIALSHYHWDHMGRISFVDSEIPVYCGETTIFLHEANHAARNSPLSGHELKKFRTGDKFRIGPMEFVPVHVDHSIPGAYGFVIHTSEGAVAYTGDFRFHGPAGSMTGDFVRAAHDAKVDVLLSEGTRVSEDDTRMDLSETSVLDEATILVKKCKKLVLSSFKGNDIDRVNTFAETCRQTGRQLVVSMKAAIVLKKLESDKGLSVPRVGKDALVYLRRKKTGKFDDKDYFPWERQFLGCGISAAEIARKEHEILLHLDVWNFPELIDMKPSSGGTYIHASTEAYNEEGEQEEEVIRNWMDHLGFGYHQLHASGHAHASGVGNLIQGITPKKVIPIHTESPLLFQNLKGSATWKLEVPTLGRPVTVSPN